MLREQFLWTEAGDKLSFYGGDDGEDGHSQEADISQDTSLSDDGAEDMTQNNGKVDILVIIEFCLRCSDSS